MENRRTTTTPGIAEVTLQAYSRRHGAQEESRGVRCRARAKPIALSIGCIILISLAVYWLIVGPIFDSLNNQKLPDRKECNDALKGFALAQAVLTLLFVR